MDLEDAHMIRLETPGDERPIQAVVEAAFAGPAEGDLVDRLREAGKLTISLVAEREGEVVGHVAFSAVTLDPEHAGLSGLGLAPVAVVPEHQKSGIGRALIEAGVEECRERGAGFIVVLGDPAYYSRFGFETASAFGLGNEYGVNEEFMVLVLGEEVAFAAGTIVRYAAEFGEV